MVRVLADAGAELERTTHEGLSPLAAACSQQLPRTAKFLLERGVKVGGVKGKEGQHFVPLVEAAARRSETLVFLLLKWGADPSQAGWERESCHQSKRYVLISPLQKAITVPYTFFFKGGDAAENIYRIVKLLIERGARCPVSTPREALNEGDSPPLSDKSHLLAACYMRHIGLVQLLCGAGGADPNVCGRATDHCQKPVSPLASVLCDRRWHKDNKIENDIKTQWELAGALVEVSRGG
uniref:Uncharacterized protein n=2 Tax=Chromera velia CCMP2878 TaxID=1169474 RepID=A0A0G4GN13_9ALVE|eukprot:Cvel_22614.t1-p1 / transcript=Cvel_22614.t1 / gene=Cvel_22614 / organism=Chromera_velia_CCMP2878 / gene_product=hypothetical protein / transcript_product=hypothetical protein / location=Cvel_scaffold2240:415-1125(-) / protein_length=237 / sequence_SO=supercontig / SO=protein_coding / is_pseudo=false